MARLRPRAVPTLAALVGVAILLGLCVWQLHRHGERNAWVAGAQAAEGLPPVADPDLTDPDPVLFRHVTLRGRFVGPVLLEGGRQIGGVPAYGVAQEFATGRVRLFVDRGEVPASGVDAGISALPDERDIEGQLRPLPEGALREPANPGGEPLVWRRRSLRAMHASVDGLAPGIYLRAGPALEVGEEPRGAGPALEVGEEPRDAGPALEAGEEPRGDSERATGYRPIVMQYQSLHYASQWAAMAAILAGLWAFASWDRS